MLSTIIGGLVLLMLVATVVVLACLVSAARGDRHMRGG